MMKGKQTGPHARRARVASTVSIVAAACYLLLLLTGMWGVARLVALIFAGSATIEIVETTDAPQPTSVALVSMCTFTLALEANTQIMTHGIDKTSFVEIGISIYLFVTLWTMVRGRNI